MPREPVPEKVQKIMKNLKDIDLSTNTIARVTEYSRKTVNKYTKKEGE